jgi:hypothetical protein
VCSYCCFFSFFFSIGGPFSLAIETQIPIFHLCLMAPLTLLFFCHTFYFFLYYRGV